jgi:hypothetical protein
VGRCFIFVLWAFVSFLFCGPLFHFNQIFVFFRIQHHIPLQAITTIPSTLFRVVRPVITPIITNPTGLRALAQLVLARFSKNSDRCKKVRSREI